MIDLLPNADQQDLIDVVRAVLNRELSSERIRAAHATGYDAQLWGLCADQGWYGLGLAANVGGVGCTIVEEALLFRELGRSLVPGPMLSTVLGAHVAAADGRNPVVEDVLGGVVRIGLAERRPGEAAALVWDAGPVELHLLLDYEDGHAFLAEASELATDEAVPSIDPAHGMARCSPTVFSEPLVSTPLAPLAAHASVLLAAQLAGLAEATRDLGAAYVKDRMQFGKPIGSFQAVKHRAADTAIRAEAAWSQVVLAALHSRNGTTEATFHASAAKVVASDAAVRNARDVIQNLGAIGFTAEHDAHLYLTRAHVLEHLFGDSPSHLRNVLDAALSTGNPQGAVDGPGT